MVGSRASTAMSAFCLLPVWLWRGDLCQRDEANSQAGTALIRSPFEAKGLHFITCITLQFGQASSTGGGSKGKAAPHTC